MNASEPSPTILPELILTVIVPVPEVCSCRPVLPETLAVEVKKILPPPESVQSPKPGGSMLPVTIAVIVPVPELCA